MHYVLILLAKCLALHHISTKNGKKKEKKKKET
jgi:hypothetical protein